MNDMGGCNSTRSMITVQSEIEKQILNKKARRIKTLFDGDEPDSCPGCGSTHFKTVLGKQECQHCGRRVLTNTFDKQ